MKRLLALVPVVAGLMLVVGCGKTEKKMVDAKTMVEPKETVKPKEMVEPKTMLDPKTTTEAQANVDRDVKQASATSEAPKQTTPGIGTAGPAWENLAGSDDKQHSLKDLEQSKAVAIVFTCNSCPVAVAYEDRLIKLANDYKDKGVTLVAINVNDSPPNNMDAMKERAEKKGFTFAYLFDPSQKIARDYGATCTPHAFLLDSERKIAYMGAIDDNMNADAVKQHGLQDAIDAVLAGNAPAVATTKQFGCGIHYE